MHVMTAQQDRFPLSRVFRIARGQRDSAQVITVNVEKNGVSGRGEGLPYARYGETPASVLAQIRALPNDIALEGFAGLAPRRRAQCGGMRALGSAGQTAGLPGLGFARHSGATTGDFGADYFA